LVITVIDYDTKQPVANAMVSLYDENGEFIMRELTTEEFEEIEKALYKEGNRKVIATTLEGD
jgi:uncharacterized surface anchored protein